ncbi:hypothetical protein BG000_004670 [Podila horticola]|nr:hypothetical protein BG000_004670 [Podila horticola]
MTTAEFLDAHEQVSGLDIVFVVRFSDLAPNDDTEGSSLTLSPDSASFDITCPIFIQVKLHKELSEAQAIKAHSTVQPRRSRITEPASASIVDHMDTTSGSSPRMKHPDGVTEIALTIDDRNIDLLSEKHVQALKDVKRLAEKMAEPQGS